MILVLLASIVSANAYPDYYAVRMEAERFKIFTKISECEGAVYQSGENRFLFQDGVWRIKTLKNDLDCNTLSSVVEEEYRTKYTAQRPEYLYWYKMTKIHYYFDYSRIWIDFEDLYKRVKYTGLKLVGGTKVEYKSKEDCLREDWGQKFPDKDVVVAFQDSNCFYDFVDQAQLHTFSKLQHSNSTLLVHPAGKNILYINNKNDF